MKNVELYQLKNGIVAIMSKQAPVEFAYAATKNLRILDQEIEIIEKTFAPSEEYMEKYQKEYDKIIREYCEKNKETGEPVIERNHEGRLVYKFSPDGKKKFEAALEKLNKKHKGLVEARDKQIKDKQKFLEKDSTVKVVKIDKKYAPHDITLAQFMDIFPMIK